MSGSLDLAALIGPVSRKLLGEPNDELSSDKELAFGTHGSLKVKLAGDKRGTWYDHEHEVGGGVFDLLREKKGVHKDDALEWLRENKFIRDISKMHIVAAYPYHGEDGTLLYEAVRLHPKTFRLRHPDGSGGWAWSLKGIDRKPYRLPELIAAPLRDPVFIVEGEKDTDNVRALGLTATCNPEGAGKWRAAFSCHFAGRRVVILPDNDDAGEKHAAGVARMLGDAAFSIRILRLPGLSEKGDISEWLAAGGTAAELLDLASQAPEIDLPERGQAEAHDDVPPDDSSPFEPDDMPAPLKVVLFNEIEAAIDVNDFIEDLLIAEGMSAVIGAPNCGKTFLVLDLAFHVARGEPWFGREVEQGGVLYVALEGGIGIRNRVAAYRQANGLDDAEIQFALITQPISLIDPEGVRALIHSTKSLAHRFESKLKLIVIDTTSRALAGGDENSSVDMGRLIANADIIRAATGAHLLFIHHSGKDATRGARGWSGLLGAIDTELEVTEDNGVRAVEVRKQRDLDKGPAFNFTLETIELGINRRGKPVRSCIVRPADQSTTVSADPARKLTGHTRRAYELLQNVVIEQGLNGFIGTPPGVLSVPEQAWRDAFYSKAMPGAEPDARKRAFRRAADGLVQFFLVAVAEGRVWITSRQQPGQDNGT